ncbi:MAG: fumarylacetoacetate hydrolase family protein [Planctomycetota bacterium]
MLSFCRYEDPGTRKTRLGILRCHCEGGLPDSVITLTDLLDLETEKRWLADNVFLQQDASEIFAKAATADAWSVAPDRFLPPVADPEKVLCIGLNYRDHAIETGSPIPDLPIVFSKFNTALVGFGDAIVLPPISNAVDYEAELVVVIGAPARCVSEANAMEHVFGFTAGHDVSSRDWQKGRPGGQWLLGKSFDTFAPVGPGVIPISQIPDWESTRVRLQMGEDCLQDSTLKQLIFGVPSLIAHLSQFMTLKPGDLIFTGTPPGVGDARVPPRYLQNGDRPRVVLGDFMSLENPVVDTT